MLSKKFTAVAGVVAELTDDYFKNVTTLLHGDGTNGAQNSSFVDSSSNAFSLTTNGQVAQGSFSPYGPNWSTYFSGAGYVQTPPSADYDISGVDFTIEFWFYWTKGNTMSGSAICLGGNFQSSVGWQVAFESSGVHNLTSCVFQAYSGGWNSVSNTSINATTLPKNSWHHIAIVRNGSGAGNLKFFLDGVNVGGAYNAPTYSGSGGNLTFGVYQQNLTYAGNPDMYVSNFRLVKGTALYTSNFTPSTTPLTSVTNTKFLGFQSSSWINNGSTGGAMTHSGNTTAIQRFSPFSKTTDYSKSTIGGSAYFVYGYPHLYTSTNSAFDFGTGDFTLEFWFYVTSGVANNARFISNTAYNGSGIDISWEAGQSRLTWYIASSAYATASLPNKNSWNHVAFSRSGTTLRVYLNGVLQNTYTGMSSNISSGSTLRIGEYGPTGYPLDKGYMSDVRLVKGTALYTGSSLTVPTAPLTAVSGTSLLLNMTNAAVVDETMANNFETGGNAQISTSVKKYGTGSMYFDGSGDYLASSNPSFILGPSGDFTIEMWVYPTTTGSYRSLVTWQNGYSANSNYSYVVGINSSNLVSNQVDDGNTQYFSTSSATVTANAWNHIAFVKNGNSIKTYLNGVGATAANPDVFNALYDGRLYIGIDMNGGSAFTGYIDDLRITKGYARYTSDFTPPTEAYPNK